MIGQLLSFANNGQVIIVIVTLAWLLDRKAWIVRGVKHVLSRVNTFFGLLLLSYV